jgi:hypothetical protein
MDVASDPNSTSALNQLRPGNADKNSIRVQISTIDAICDQEGIDHIDILKTDTEGYDAEVLARAHRMLSKGQVQCLMCEVGFLADKQHTDFTKVFLFLHQLGFEIAGIYETTYFRNGRTDFTNALFVQRGTKPKQRLPAARAETAYSSMSSPLPAARENMACACGPPDTDARPQRDKIWPTSVTCPRRTVRRSLR